MKRLFFLIPALCVFCIAAYGQDSRQQAMFDSVMQLMRDKSIPLIERYYMTGNIERLARENQIAVFQELLPEANRHEDMAVRIRLYALIADNKSQLLKFDEAQPYLDSAFMYVDKTDNIVIKGVASYIAGNFYSRQNKISDAHKHYYNAAEFFKRKDPQLHILNELYFALSNVYACRNDVESLKDLVDWMRDLSTLTSLQKTYRHTVQARYFMALHNKTGDFSYLDSIIACNKKVFEIHLTEEHPYDAIWQISENYLMQAETCWNLRQNDSAQFYLNKTTELMNPENRWQVLQAELLNSRLLYDHEKYKEAEAALAKGITELDSLISSQDLLFYNLLASYYLLLSQAQEKQMHIKEALASGQKSLKYEQLYNDSYSAGYIQDLRIKYSLQDKETLIDRLTGLNKALKQNQTLYYSIAALLGVIALMVLILWRREKKMAQARLNEVKLNAKIESTQAYIDGLENERLRISKELHDDVAGNILSLNFHLQSAHPALSGELKQIYEQVRNLSHELMPPAFYHASLTEILQDYVNRQNRICQTKIALSISSETDVNQIPQKMCFELYRIIQECTNNAIKHSGASTIDILLNIENKNLNLTILDNGQGFAETAKEHGIGMVITKDRVKSMNGVIQFHSTQGKGVEIRITTPIDASSTAKCNLGSKKTD